MKYNNPIKCEVCGGVNFADDYGNSDIPIAVGWHAVIMNKWKNGMA